MNMEKRKTCLEKSGSYFPLPLIEENGHFYKFKAVFNGYHVIINDPEDMKKVNDMGTFGKGTLSRNKPQFTQHTRVIRERQLRYRNDLIGKQGVSSENKKAVLVTADSEEDENPVCETESDSYFTNLKVEYAMDHSGQVEVIHLLLEEAFFLLKLDCLAINDANGTLLDLVGAWKVFMQLDNLFVQNYAFYHYYRSKNWIVKPGLKFGGDYVLYKESPQHCHSSYVIIIDVLNEHLERDKEKTRRSMKICHLLGLNRLCETAGKDLLIAHLIWPRELHVADYKCINQFVIKEVCFKRWRNKLENK